MTCPVYRDLTWRNYLTWPGCIKSVYNEHLSHKVDNISVALVPTTMLLRNLYRCTILTQETALAFSRDHNLLDTQQRSRSPLLDEEYKAELRCPRKRCHFTFCSGRKHIFPLYGRHNRLHCNLSFVTETLLNIEVTLSLKSSITITDLYTNMCREVCGAIMSHEQWADRDAEGQRCSSCWRRWRRWAHTHTQKKK